MRPPLQAPKLWQCYLAFWIFGILGSVWIKPALLCAFFLPVADSRLRRPCRLVFAVLVFGVGFVLAGRQLDAVSLSSTLVADIRQSHAPRLCGSIRNVQTLPDNRLRISLEQANFQSNPGAGLEAVPGVVAWTWENPFLNPLIGQSVCLERRPHPVHGFANEGMADGDIWQRTHGVSLQLWTSADQGNPNFGGRGNFLAELRENLRVKFAVALSPVGLEGQETTKMTQGRSVLVALLFGDRRFIGQQTMNNFATATLAHSLALSGQHLAIAGLAGWLCILAAARIRAPLYLHKPRLIWATLAAWPPALVYLWLGNAPPSLVRAACMLFVLGIWLMRQKVFTALDIVCLAVLCITAIEPLLVFDTGLQLSVLCVCCIGLCSPFLRGIAFRQDHDKSTLRKLLRGLWQILFISLVLQIMLLPLNLLFFGNAGFWFPLNVIWLPVLGFFILPGAFLGLILHVAGAEQIAPALLFLAAFPAQILVDMLSWLNTHGLLDSPALLRPHWTALPAFAALACAAALGAGRQKPLKSAWRLLALGCILLAVGPLLRIQERATEDVRLNVLDVGQGQAVVLDLPEGQRLLLDGGGSASLRFDTGKAVVGPVLSYNVAPRLAAVLNSHPDTDHLRGLLYVLAAFEVGRIFDNGQPAKGWLQQKWEGFSARRCSLGAGDILDLGSQERGLRLEVLWPPHSLQQEGGSSGRKASDNDLSLVLRLTRFGQGLALIPGDCGAETFGKLLAQGLDMRAKVLVAPHHGSDASFHPNFYRAVAPEFVVASCGFQNQYGHPGRKLQSWLEQEGIPLFTTAQSGQIGLQFLQDASVRTKHARIIKAE